MKTNLIRGIAALAAIAALCILLTRQKTSAPDPQVNHENEEEEEARFHEARVRYEFDMIKDPATGKIPEGIFQEELAFARAMPVRNGSSTDQRTSALNNYFPAGPNNVGGRTRAAAYDVRYNGTTNRVLIAGSVSGGIMRSTDGGNTWTLVTPENDIHNLTALAQDPRPGFQDTWYAGGGEAYGNSASELGATYLGHGLWKSIDNGATWTKLPLNTITDINGNLLSPGTLEAFDHPFDFVHRLAVNPQTGDLYVAGHRRVMRSTNGGATFQVVLGSPTAATSTTGQTEVTISNAGRILAAINGGHPDASFRGVWVSSTGSLNSFTRIAGGQTLGVDSVDGWRANDPTGGGKRIIMTLAPSNNNVVYVFYENGLSSDQAQPEGDLYRLDISTATPSTYIWSNRSANLPNHPAGDQSGSDPLSLQGGYNMVVAVKPDNPDMVFVGGTNLYRSSDGFTTN
ncbi:MAG TPA: sialidase family protein, partial [Flavisolibacter sp.]